MKLSTRGRYGIHAMYDLALHQDEGPQSIKQIAERQSISEAYLEQLFGALKRDGLLQSTRGAQGGYMLARKPEEITIGDVLRSLEDGLNLTDCLEGEDQCMRAAVCPSRQVWKKVQDGLNAVVNGITLKDMITDQECTEAQEG